MTNAKLTIDRQATIAQVDKACEKLDFDALIERALQNTELVKVRYNG